MEVVQYLSVGAGAGSYPGPNAFGTVSVRQCVAGLLEGHRGGANVSDHDGSAVPTQRILQITDKCTVAQHVSRPTPHSHTQQQGMKLHLEQPSQLAVPVVDVLCAVLVAERVDAVSQSQQGAVDVGALL